MLKYLWLSLLCVIADQVTKVWVQAELTLYERVPVWPFFNLTLVYNEGAAFSFLGDASGWQRWFFISVAVVVSTVMIIWLSRLTVAERLVALALSLVIGGAIGNLIDRLVYGHVVDFLDFFWGTWHWPAFNVADSCIFVGVALLLVDGLFSESGSQK